jgi:hypothetical protein
VWRLASLRAAGAWNRCRGLARVGCDRLASLTICKRINAKRLRHAPLADALRKAHADLAKAVAARHSCGAKQELS